MKQAPHPVVAALDTETGGFNPERFSILSFAMVLFNNTGGPAAEISFFVAEPDIFAEPDALAINRIDLKWLATHGASVSTAARLVSDFVSANCDIEAGQRVMLAGHNVAFDVAFMRRLFRLANVEYGRLFSHRTIDTAGILQFLSMCGKLPALEWSSTAAFEHFGIVVPAGERHTALGDARATSRLLAEMVDLAGNPTPLVKRARQSTRPNKKQGS